LSGTHDQFRIHNENEMKILSAIQMFCSLTGYRAGCRVPFMYLINLTLVTGVVENQFTDGHSIPETVIGGC
jgi:hypothetical protein